MATSVPNYANKFWQCPHPNCRQLNETFLHPQKCRACGTAKPPKISYRGHLIVSYYVRGHERDPDGCWLPPNDATDTDCGNLAALGLLKRAPAPNADCFQITETGRIRRYTVEGE